MIRDLAESDLEDATDAELAEAIREYGHKADDAAMAAIIGIIRLPPKERGEVVSYFRHTHLICNECGRASCVHGYSDE